MNTKILNDTTEEIEEAARMIAGGGLVAFPTETVYGLGADALNSDAVSRVYAAKGRPSDNPMIVHISSDEDLKDVYKRQHKSYLVNLKHLRKINNYEAVLDTGETLPVPRLRFQSVKEAFAAYKGAL